MNKAVHRGYGIEESDLCGVIIVRVVTSRRL